ncbi:39S ribosomal protein L44, mitochondrial [Leptopilina heterotoma]|uniref:39S ribosomal protein L44, mitochondrial n=1 Tax=Leptopilina heterotoma TaxID=63436 RepID=UPI001CA97DF6|nr:39S ribosomal protein L44, mitochondrial [Leptopilina heterotoma]
MNSLRNCSKLLLNISKANLLNYTAQRNMRRTLAPTLIELTRRKRALKTKKPEIRNQFLEWNRDSELYAFNQRLSEKFDMDSLERSLTHRSYIIMEEEKQKKAGIENPEINRNDNRELIEEGKTILPQIVENYLSVSLPYAPRECIQTLSNYLLSTEMLSKVTKGIGLEELILSAEFPIDEITLVNTFYALIASLKNCVDLNHASIFVRDFLIVNLAEKDLMEIYCPDEPIDVIDDILGNENREPVEPRIIGQSGVTTIQSVYHIGLYSGEDFLGSGFGDSIEEAKTAAAIKTLSEMFGLTDSSQPIRCDLKINQPVESVPLKTWRRSNA